MGTYHPPRIIYLIVQLLPSKHFPDDGNCKILSEGNFLILSIPTAATPWGLPTAATPWGCSVTIQLRRKYDAMDIGCGGALQNATERIIINVIDGCLVSVVSRQAIIVMSYAMLCT